MASNEAPQRQSIWVELFHSENYYPVLQVISSYLTIADSFALCQVCKGLEGLKDHMLKTVSNVNIPLRDFVDDPTMFRSQLGHHDALISGSFALNLFELGHRKVPCLDVFVKEGAHADHFTKYVQENEGYQIDDLENGTVKAQLPKNLESVARPGKKLRVVRTSGPPIQHILTSSHTTACVNFLTWNKAYSIFPQQTLSKHHSYPLKSLDDDFGSTLNELVHQGWTTRDIMWPDFAETNTSKIAGLRRVGDSSTLVIPLDTSSVDVPSTPDFVVEYAQFEIHAQEMVSPAMRHGYTTASSTWRSYVTERLQRWTWLELYKVEPENRPFQSPAALPLVSDVSIPEEFELPQSWDYADDQMPVWYREWEHIQTGKGLL
ncbi:hypothetical protein BKA56DRAFT_501478 [Ilyonectria sp. MPI-CAGE-AT-0026]|nr:hypothetical protein BKA56DRAFT_501478 [Ilyonectria sp. MPI-CAGE-AT-0026]